MTLPAIHPREHLAEELRELDMRAAAQAGQIRVPTNRITGILNGRRAITGDTALRLGHFFGTSPEFWLNLQKLYELRHAEQRAGRRLFRWTSSRRAGPALPLWIPASAGMTNGGSGDQRVANSPESR